MREGIFGGVDTNYLDFGTPGWTRDPTTGVLNTSGFPGATPTGPQSGSLDLFGTGQGVPFENFDQFITRLHDSGMTNAEISAFVGPNGFRQDDAGNWTWGWGTGPVIRDPTTGEYLFANQRVTQGDISMDPFNLGGGMFGPADRGGGSGFGGGGSQGGADDSNAERNFNDFVGAADFFHGMYY